MTFTQWLMKNKFRPTQLQLEFAEHLDKPHKLFLSGRQCGKTWIWNRYEEYCKVYKDQLVKEKLNK